MQDPQQAESFGRRVRRALARSPYEPYSGSSPHREAQTALASDEIGYSGTQTARIVGVTFRQLDYWARTELIRPSLGTAPGHRTYSYQDLLELRAVKTLLDAGIRLESVRNVLKYLRPYGSDDFASAHLVISGEDVMVCDGDRLVDVLRAGQGVLNVLPLAGVKDDIDARLEPTEDWAEPAGA